MAPRSSTSTHIHRSTHVHNIMDMLDEHSAPLKNTLAARVFFLSFSLGCALPPVSQSGNDDVTVSSSGHRAPL